MIIIVNLLPLPPQKPVRPCAAFLEFITFLGTVFRSAGLTDVRTRAPGPSRIQAGIFGRLRLDCPAGILPSHVWPCNRCSKQLNRVE
jgi:hypothetical protein